MYIQINNILTFAKLVKVVTIPVYSKFLYKQSPPAAIRQSFYVLGVIMGDKWIEEKIAPHLLGQNQQLR